MFRRAASCAAKIAAGVGSLQLGAAAVALTDKQLGKKPEWYKNDVIALENSIKQLSSYRYIESEDVLESAEEVFQRFADLNSPEILWRLARVYAEKSQLTKDQAKQKQLLTDALHAVEKALTLEGKNGIASAHRWYAQIAFWLANVDSKAAKCPKLKEKILTHLKRATELNPKDPFAHHLLGVALYKNKDYKGAIAHFEKAESIKAGFSAANLFYLGDAQRLNGQKAEAITTLKKAFNAPSKNQFDTKGKSQAKQILLTKLKQKLEEIEAQEEF